MSEDDRFMRVRGELNSDFYKKARDKYKSFTNSARTKFQRLLGLYNKQTLNIAKNPAEHATFYHLNKLRLRSNFRGYFNLHTFYDYSIYILSLCIDTFIAFCCGRTSRSCKSKCKEATFEPRKKEFETTERRRYLCLIHSNHITQFSFIPVWSTSCGTGGVPPGHNMYTTSLN
jgi:hypothetical protein